MKKVLVTGAGGLLGSYIVKDLIADREVVSLDRRRPRADIPHIDADVLDLAAAKRAATGMDAVVHVAAAANIASAAPEVIIDVNVRGTWNVLEAAATAGVRRVVLCSSDSVMGNTVWPEHYWKPDYLPVDERHAVRPTDPYGLSKLLAEQAGRSFAARGVMEVVALRPVFILFPSMMGEVRARHRNPEHYKGPCAGGHVAAGGGLCWHHVDPIDVASAFRRALDYAYQGFESFYVAADSTLRPEPTLDRIRSVFGAVPDQTEDAWFATNPFAPMFDTRRARVALGWTPRHDRRQEVIAT